MAGGHPEAAVKAHRARMRMLVRVTGSLVILGLLLTFLPAAELWRTVRSLPVWVWPVGVAAYLSFHLIGVGKWRLLVNAAGADLPVKSAARAYYWGLFGNLFLPSIVGGDLVRAGVAMREARSKSGLLLGSVADRAQDVVGLGALAGVGALLSPQALDEGSRRVFTWLVAVMLAGGLATVAVAGLMPVRRLPFSVRRKLVAIRGALRAAAARPSALIRAFGAGLVLQSLFVVLNWWLGLQMGIVIPLYVWFFAWPLAKLSGLLPITQGGIGVREAAQAALLAPFGVSSVAAVATGLAFEVVILSGGLAAGVISLALRPSGTPLADGAPAPGRVGASRAGRDSARRRTSPP